MEQWAHQTRVMKKTVFRGYQQGCMLMVASTPSLTGRGGFKAGGTVRGGWPGWPQEPRVCPNWSQVSPCSKCLSPPGSGQYQGDAARGTGGRRASQGPSWGPTGACPVQCDLGQLLLTVRQTTSQKSYFPKIRLLQDFHLQQNGLGGQEFPCPQLLPPFPCLEAHVGTCVSMWWRWNGTADPTYGSLWPCSQSQMLVSPE